MGCCFSKKRMKHPDGSAAVPRRYKPEDRDPPPPPSPEEEKVKEVLSETPSTKVAAEPKPVANVVAVEEQEVLKVKASVDPVPAVSDLGSCLSMATDERSPPPQPEDDAVTTAGEESVAEANAGADGDGEGKESLENPLVSMECFIFL
ncbi:unnamed protein product [Triticum turgidum subsp. durum]|uniref:Uncharacterized protein n=1 Tax=Triticum turgidum subsp. durum TaxID=4567 RepID=A0A9R1QMT1_TRITD|nr:unnamed protein product [Triticum turgidum subsp. durum]